MLDLKPWTTDNNPDLPPILQWIDINGEPLKPLEQPIDRAWLIKAYQAMWLTRLLDQRAINLQRTGNLGTYPASTGQEAVSVGIGLAISPQDIFCPYYRDQGTLLLRGVTASEILQIWGGDERGYRYQNRQCHRDLPYCLPIAGQCVHAAGVAYAVKYRQQNAAVLVTLGDGATSKGDFYEAINACGALALPLVFVINNNQWAISLPLSQQTSCSTLAQKAWAGGLHAMRVDGNDVLAVFAATQYALQQARQGQGIVIEALTYRLCDHTTADDAGRYQSSDQLAAAWQREPIARLQKLLQSHFNWDNEQQNDLIKDCQHRIEIAVEQYLNLDPPALSDTYKYLYANLPPSIRQQVEAESILIEDNRCLS